MKCAVNFRHMKSEAMREAYASAWEEAGGTVEDTDTPAPYCCPWFWAGVELLDLPECHTLGDIARAMLDLHPEARVNRG